MWFESLGICSRKQAPLYTQYPWETEAPVDDVGSSTGGKDSVGGEDTDEDKHVIISEGSF